jgi:hypothetical protein
VPLTFSSAVDMVYSMDFEVGIYMLLLNTSDVFQIINPGLKRI